MRIDLTVDTGTVSRDVRIDAAPGTTFGAIRESLSDVAGFDPHAELWTDAAPVTDSAPLGTVGLRSGSRLSTVPPGRRSVPGPVPGLAAAVVAGPASGATAALGRSAVVLGRAPDCDLVLEDDHVSRHHATIERTGHGIRVRDLGSTNGTRIERRPVDEGGAALAPDELVEVGDSLIGVVRDGDDPPSAVSEVDGTVLINRVPRRREPIEAVEVVQSAGPSATRPRRVPWLAAALPAVVGGVAALVLRSPVLLLFSLLSPLIVLSTAWGEHLSWRRSRGTRARDAAQARSQADAEASRAVQAEVRARRRAAPDPVAVVRAAVTPTRRLWERDSDDPMFGHVRVGVTDVPATVRIRRGDRSEVAGSAVGVPLLADLTLGSIGIAGPRAAALALARWLMLQLAVLHAPTQLRLVAAIGAAAGDDWAWLRWLPHLGDLAFATDADLPAAVEEITRAVRRTASGPDAHRPVRRPVGRWTVVVADLGTGAPLPPELAGGPGVCSVLVVADESALPPTCHWRAVIDGEAGTRVRLGHAGDARTQAAVTDACPSGLAEAAARALAPMIDATRRDDEQLPVVCRLLPLLGLAMPTTGAVLHAWAAQHQDTVLGSGSDGAVTLDLDRDGPHVLIAGTTGSGKSVLLQTLVAGLAARCPPDALNLILVDYKGGAAFAACTELPHTVGVVTDLDPVLTARALRSLDAELRRRERAFAAAGVSDLVGYRARDGGEPVARLVIVVDEFATLADELPEFVSGLVSVAQRGRSLGLHLVLATQRPGGSVSADIRANVSTRIALRMSEEAESIDVLGSPVAAVGRCPPGRAWLAKGSEVTAFQAALIAGVVAPPDGPVVAPLGPWRRPLTPSVSAQGADDLSTLVAAIGAAAVERGGPAPAPPWLPPLPARVSLDDLRSERSDGVVLGLVDLPDEQAQRPLTLGLVPGSSVLVIGGPGTGRTTALIDAALSLAAGYAPGRVHLHILDAMGTLTAALEGLPHVVTALGPDGGELAATLLRRLGGEIAHRASATAAASPAPALILLVDGWDTLLGALGEIEAARCVELLGELVHSGASAGFSVVVTGGASLLGTRLASGFALRLVLRLPDPAGYGILGIAARDVPAAMPPGRCLRAGDGAQVQLADPGGAPGSSALRDTIVAVAGGWPDVSRGPSIEVRPLPARVALGDLAADASTIRLGLGGDAATTVGIDLSGGARRLLVAGPPRSGRSTVLTTLATEASRTGWSIVVAAPTRSPLRALAAGRGWLGVDPGTPATAVHPPAGRRVLLLVDDATEFDHTDAGERLLRWVRNPTADIAVALSGRPDELATSFRGLGAEVRRARCGVLLRPGPIDGDLLGVRLPRAAPAHPAGRGWCVGEPAWGALFSSGEPVALQVALP